MNERLEFRVEEVNNELEKKGKEYRLEYRKVFKPNGEKDAVSVIEKGANMSPTIYNLDFLNEDINDVISYIEEILSKASKESFNTSELLNRNYVLENVYPMLLHESNIDSLIENKIAFEKCADTDLVIIFYINVGQKGEHIGTSKLTRPILENLKIEDDELNKRAFDNLEKETSVRTMREVISSMVGIPEEDLPDFEKTDREMLVVTNKDKMFGASAILTNTVAEKIRKTEGFGDRFIVLPSSIHEVLVLPYNEEFDELTNMVQEVNDTEVDPDEVLANHVYIYDCGTLQSCAQ